MVCWWLLVTLAQASRDSINKCANNMIPCLTYGRTVCVCVHSGSQGSRHHVCPWALVSMQKKFHHITSNFDPNYLAPDGPLLAESTT